MTADEKERLYTEYRGKVTSYIRSRIYNESDVEDLCEDVFVKAFSCADDYDPSKASVGTWIYTITKNTVIDYCRRARPTEEIPEDVPGDSSPEDEVTNAEMLRELAGALEDLPDELTDVIVLHYYDRMPLTEIAGTLGISYGMVKIRHNKALSALRTALG